MPFDGTDLSPVVQHILRAKRYLIEKGWCPNAAYDDGGRVCIATALGDTADGVIFDKASWYMGMALNVEPSYVDGHTIGVWNDTPGRKLEEVLDAFDRAAALAIND